MIILLAVSFGACSGKQAPPDDILSKQQFTHLLIEIHLIESKIERLYVNADSAKVLYNYFQSLLLEEEGIDSLTFQKTLDYYKDNPKPYLKVYEAVTDSLLEMEAKGKLTLRETEKEKEAKKEETQDKEKSVEEEMEAESDSLKNSKIRMKKGNAEEVKLKTIKKD